MYKYNKIVFIYYARCYDLNITEKFQNWSEFVAYVEKNFEPFMSIQELAEFWNWVYDVLDFDNDDNLIIDIS